MKPGNIPTVSTGRPAPICYRISDLYVGSTEDERGREVTLYLNAEGLSLWRLYDNARITRVDADGNRAPDGHPDDHPDSVRERCMDAFEASVQASLIRRGRVSA